MIIVLQVVGIPVKEFSFGITLILAGTVGLCTGLLLLGLSVVAWELRLVARRLAAPRPAADPRARPVLPPFPSAAQAEGGPSFSRDQPPPPSIEPSVAPPVAPLRHEDTRARQDAPLEADSSQAGAAPPKPRRNLLFSSTMRKDRERTAAPSADPAAPDLRAPASAPPPLPEASEAPPASFEDAWPKSGRARAGELPSQRRAGR